MFVHLFHALHENGNMQHVMCHQDLALAFSLSVRSFRARRLNAQPWQDVSTLGLSGAARSKGLGPVFVLECQSAHQTK